MLSTVFPAHGTQADGREMSRLLEGSLARKKAQNSVSGLLKVIGTYIQ